MAFAGFPRRVRFTPVPDPVFGPLLEQIDDLAELKCTLRVIWALHQKRGYPRFVTLSALLADRTLSRALADGDSPRRLRVEAALAHAVERGTLVSGTVQLDDGQERIYMLNTEADRSALAAISEADLSPQQVPVDEPWEGAVQQPNIFALYEDNVGMLSPMMADELREAEQVYPAPWIEEAFREAVSQNKRSWRYITRILERWEREGRGDGEPGRRPKTAGYY
ncbi:MAG: DnaD domain protein [Chloroflexi bacterium]|nr:DnaD domain protein [Chloroflexota bacterium]